eukprot:s843_g5.t1
MGSIGPLGACTDYYVWLVAILCLLTTQVRSLSNANVFTQISLVCILGMIICMLVAVFEYDIEEKDLSMMVVRLASGCTISSWAYVPAFLTVELSACMETPAEFKKSLLFSGGLNVLVFIIVGSIVVARWGFEVGEVISITAGVGAWVPGTDVNTIFSCFKLGGNFVSYMLDSVPLCRFCQRSWAPSFKDTWSASDVMRYLGYTLPTFILALVLATFTPSIGTLLDFVTALTTPWVTQIYPALLYWKFLRDRDSDGESGKSSQASRSMVLEKAAVLFVLFVGYVSFVMCSVKAVGYLAIEDLRPKFQIGCSGWVLWESSANKVNEVADLVDKLGRAVLQRDENIREKSKAQVRLTKVEADLRALSEECGRLKRQNKSLGDQLKEANRRAKFVPPRPDADAPDDSDEEFEHELLAFEQRFIILEEGPAGLDILASNLSKDKLNLEKRLKSSNENVDSLTASVGEWRRLSEEKDLEISDLSTKLDQMMREHAALEEAIAQKRREIEQQVAEEKAALEAKVQELQLECDNARAISDGMDKASNREAEKKRTAEEASATGALGGVASTDEKEVSEAFGNSTTSASGQPPESRFYELINHEMQKVNRHFSLQLRSIVDRLAFAGNSALSSGVHGALGDDQDNLKEAQAALFQHVKAGGGGDNLPVAAKFLQTAADVLVELDNYRSLNKTAFRQEGSPATRGRTLVKNFDLVFPAQQGHLASTPESMSGEGLTSELQKLIRAMGMGIMQSRLYSKTSLLRLALGGLPDVPEAAGKGNGEGSDLVELDRSSAALDVHAFTPVQQLGSPEAFLMEGRPDESSR